MRFTKFFAKLILGVMLVSTLNNNTAACAASPEETRASAEKLIEVCAQKNSGFKKLIDLDNKYNLAGVQNVHMISMLTGEYSINQTKSNYKVGGTDLGVMANKGNTTYIFFGDTFLHENQTELWRNNVAAYTTDSDYTDGILFDGMIMTNSKMSKELQQAKELIPGQKFDNVEMAKIPTGALCIGDTLYLSYMSVRHWGPGDGVWQCSKGGVAKSVNDGKTWNYVKDLTWGEDSGFCQMYPVRNGNMIYVVGIGGGRFGGAKLMRVPEAEYENKDAYEYFTGTNEDGSPVFVKGEEGLKAASSILKPAVGEMSVLYSEYLEEWIIMYLSGNDIILRTSKELWGPWSKPVSVVSRDEYPIVYGAFMNERYVSEDGSKIAFLMSLWAPIYNTMVMEMELVRK